MTTAEQTYEPDDAETPALITSIKPEPTSEPTPEPPKKKKVKAEGGGDGQSAPTPLREMRINEMTALKDIMEMLGERGTYKIAVGRIEPKQFRDPATGRLLVCGGHLESYEEPVDEEFLKSRHGGGKFELKFNRRHANGSFQYAGYRRVDIAGDPIIDELRTGPAGAPPASHVASEAPSVATKAMDMMGSMLERQMQMKQQPPPSDNTALVEMFRVQIAGLQAQLATMEAARVQERKDHTQQLDSLRAELTAARNFKPEEDPIKNKILNNLLDGESGRVTALRTTHESEIRTIKANAIEDEKRLRDAFDRDKMTITASFDRERTTMIHSNEMTMAAMKASLEAQNKMLEGQIRTLERDNGELRIEVKDLRAKKEKGIVEMVKEMEVIKDALGAGDEKDSSAIEQILAAATDPNTPALLRTFMGKPGAEAAKPATGNPAPQQQVGPPAGGYKPQIVKAQDGKTYLLNADGSAREVKKKGAGQTAGSAPEIPVIAEDVVKRAVTMLENAFTGGRDPEDVALGAKALVPAEVIQALRDIGPDAFMSKIAKVPPNSSLSSQEARAWIRRVSKAIVGG